ncbi:MAG: MarR family transcriptional regulator [Spirochaetes bacterium]|nr:MarR family transcriptional regulator [Spirochaetota bacterium]
MSEHRPAVAVYGGANIDIQARCRARYRPGDSNPGTAFMSAGGVGRNIAENLARLGLRTELVTVFGGDETASSLAERCRDAGIEVGRSLILPGEPTPRYVCILDDDGVLVGAVAAMDALERFGPDELARRYGPGDEADVVVIDANLPAGTIAAAASRWSGKPLILDSVSVAKAAKAAPVVGRFSIVKPNRREALALLGLDPDASPDAARPDEPAGTVGSAAASARALLALGVREAFVSLGAEGLLWASAAGIGVARPLGLQVANVSGAGDAATAALAWASARGAGTEAKAAFAVAAASFCASSDDAVAAGMNASRLEQLAIGVRSERLS